jgi:CHASE3 domain sensor protein
MRFSINTILPSGIVLSALAIVFVLFISVRQSRKVHDTSESVSHTENVLLHIQKPVVSVPDNEASARGYAIAGTREFPEPLRESEKNAIAELAFPEKLVNNQRVRQLLTDSLSLYTQKRLGFSNRMVRVRQEEGLQSVSALIVEGGGKYEGPDIQKCYNPGANSYIVKPVNFEGFAQAIKNPGFYWLLLNQSPL